MFLRSTSVYCLLLATGLIVATSGCSKPENAYKPPPPPEVTVANPLARPIPEFLEEEGEIEVAEEAEVRARVKGFIEGIEFEPGQRVEEGQVLYLIEPDTYQAALDSARAAVAAADASILVANATLRNTEAESVRTQADLSREKRLLEGNAGSQSDYDRAFAANESAKAAIEAAKASIEEAKAEKQASEAALQQAELDFGYTKVVAPISGRITKTTVKMGNLVENGTQLATVVNIDRVFANFSLSDRQALQLQQEHAEIHGEPTDEKEDWTAIKVLLKREIDDGFPYTGQLDYVDQRGVDASTATLGLRAVFDNPGRDLVGGLFVTVRVPSAQLYDALLVPELAVSRDQQGSYVLTVNAESEVTISRVSVRTRTGGWAAVEGDVDTDSRIIVDGLQRAMPGSKVTPVDTKLEVDDETLLRGTRSPPTKKVSDTDAEMEPNATSENASESDPAVSESGSDVDE